MNRFAALLDRLATAGDADTAERVLADYFTHATDADRGAALGLLLGAVPLGRISPAALRALAAERLDPELLAISRETTGDFGEAIALMWPTPPDVGPPPLAEAVAALASASDKRALASSLELLLNRLEPSGRAALVRLATGRLAKPQISLAIAQGALARFAGKTRGEIETAWADAAPPYDALFAWAAGRAPAPPISTTAAFRALAPIRTLTNDDVRRLDLAAHAVEHAWDGTRALAAARGNERRIWSRRGEDLTAAHPHIVDALSFQGVIEGMIVASESGPQLVAHDLLEAGGQSLEREPLRTRRAQLEALLVPHAGPALALGALVDVGSWPDMEAARTAAQSLGARGLVLKRWDAPYPEPDNEPAWLFWAAPEKTLHAVLLYLEHGSGGPEATLGVWDEDALVAIAKAAVPDDDHGAAIETYAREHAIERFGPVLQVRADREVALMVELAYTVAERARRRKSGLFLRDARILGVKDDAPPKDAARIEHVAALVR